MREGWITEAEARETLEDVSERVGLVEDIGDAAAIIINDAMRRANSLFDEETRHDTACEKKAAWIDRRHGIPSGDVAAGPTIAPLQFLDVSSWDTDPIPQIEWAVEDRIPLRQVSVLSGEGAVGKTLIALQRCAAHVTGRPWLGMNVAKGSAIYIGAEDEAGIIHQRMIDIAAHYEVTFSKLTGQLHLLSLAGEDAILGAPKRARREKSAQF